MNDRSLACWLALLFVLGVIVGALLRTPEAHADNACEDRQTRALEEIARQVRRIADRQ